MTDALNGVLVTPGPHSVLQHLLMDACTDKRTVKQHFDVGLGKDAACLAV